MKQRKIVLVTGLTRIWAGITNIAQGLFEENIRFVYFYQEVLDIHTFQNNRLYDIEFAPIERFKNLVQFFKLIRTTRPSHIEFYHHLYDPWLIIGQLVIAKIFNLPIMTICTGGEIRKWEAHNRLKRFSIRLSFLFSRVVILKEVYMKDYVIKHRIGNVKKCQLLNNAMLVGSEPSYIRNKPNVLFLNRFNPYRNVELIIKAAKLVLNQRPNTQFLLVGKLGYSTENTYQEIILDLKLQDSVKLLPFTTDPHSYYDNASIFLLPADVVFCNNALLEAMERGVPPIVSDVDGAELIVEHCVSGLIVPRDHEELAKAILLLLEDEELRVKLGRGARKKIEQDFNEKQRAESLLTIYTNKVW